MLYSSTPSPSQSASAYLVSVICVLSVCTLHFSQIGLHAVPWMGHDDSCLCVFLHALCPVRNSPSQLTESLAVFQRALFVLLEHPVPCSLPILPPATSYSSHSPGMCCVLCSFTSLDFTLATPLPVEINVHPSRTSWNTALFRQLYKPPSFPYAYTLQLCHTESQLSLIEMFLCFASHKILGLTHFSLHCGSQCRVSCRFHIWQVFMECRIHRIIRKLLGFKMLRTISEVETSVKLTEIYCNIVLVMAWLSWISLVFTIGTKNQCTPFEMQFGKMYSDT